MKKLFIAALLATASITAAPVAAVEINCNSVNLAEMSDEKIAAVRTACTTPAKAAADAVTPEKVKEWGSLGKEFSDAMLETARGLGMAVNEFLMTPAGFLVALYFMWDVIGGILVGIPLLIALWLMYFVICRKMTIRSETYENVPILWGAFTRQKVVTRELDKETGGIYGVMAAVCTVLSMLVLGTVIF